MKLTITPNIKRCCDELPVLPKVRAILSWNHEPPANQPNWMPTWGNRVERHIQIDSRRGLWCWFKDIIGKDPASLSSAIETIPNDIIKDMLKTVSADSVVMPQKISLLKESDVAKPELSIVELKEIYKKKKVEDSRIAHKTLSSFLAQKNTEVQKKYGILLSEAAIDLSSVIDFATKSKFNTSYEELCCVGLNRDLNTLVGNMLVKKPYGYSGGLCTFGSREYIAFYIDFGTGWEYQGTSSVVVHDISEIPETGLWYSVELPIALYPHQKKWCETGKAKVRAILSWNTQPAPNNPDYIAPWGDREECFIEVKPLPDGVPDDVSVPIPFIESLGGMPVSLIDPVTGLANGSNSSGLIGNDSPFDGRILINGVILNAPDSYGPQANLEYKIMVKGPNESGYTPSPRPFQLFVTTYTDGISSLPDLVWRIPDSLGYVGYLPDAIAPKMKSVDHSKLGEFYTPISGLYSLYIEVFDPNAGSTYVSNTVNFMVDKTAPSVSINITSGRGNCGVFGDNETMQGTFSISGDYCDYVRLYITPSGSGWPSNGATPVIVGKTDNRLDYGVDLPNNGISGSWTLQTAPMEPCGYNIWVHGEDRTIVDSNHRGQEVWASRGFCVLPDDEKGV